VKNAKYAFYQYILKKITAITLQQTYDLLSKVENKNDLLRAHGQTSTAQLLRAHLFQSN
jgi:hypothetical protein